MIPAVLLALVASCGSSVATDGTAGDAADAGTDAAVNDAAAADAGTPVRTGVTFTTSDGLTIAGTLTTSAASPDGAPGVVLIHQFMSSSAQWGDLPEALAESGWRVLAFDLRGHGASDPYGGAGGLTALLNDPDGAPLDVDAAIAYLSGAGGADPARIGVVGTSIGANLAVAAAIGDRARTYVAFSARIPPTESLAAAPATGMASVFYVASELDTGGQAADAQTLFDATSDPRDVLVYAGTADHGIAILMAQSDAQDRLIAWLAATL